MAKAHGKKARVYGNGIDLSSFLRMAKRIGDADVADASTFAANDKSFVVGMVGGSLSLEGIYSAREKEEKAAEVADVLDAALGSGTELVAVHLPQGDGFGNVAYLFKGNENAIEVTSPYDDVVKITGEAQSNIGFKSGKSLVPKAEKAASGESEPIDNGVAAGKTEHGGVGLIELFALSVGKKLEVKIQHSADNITYADLITFTTLEASTGAEAIVLPLATTVNRYVKAKWTLSGGTATFHVSFARNIS